MTDFSQLPDDPAVLKEIIRELQGRLQGQGRDCQSCDSMPSLVCHKRILSSIPAPVFVKDGKSRLVFVNEAFCQMMQCTQEELLGKTDLDIHPQDEAEYYMGLDRQVVENGGAVSYERDMTVNDRTLRVITIKSLQHDSATGEPLVFCSIRDITAQHNAEKALEASLSLFRAMADNMIDMLWAKDLEGRYIFANRAICEHLLHCDDFNPIGMTDVFFAKRQRDLGWTHTFGELCFNSDEIVLEQKAPGRFMEDGLVQNQYIALDVQKSPLYDNEGQLIGTVGTGRDITEALRDRVALEENERKLSQIIESIHDGIWSYNTYTEEFGCSLQWAEMLGYKLEDIPTGHCPVIDLVHPDDRDFFKASLEEYLSGRSDSYSMQYRLRTAEGGWKWILSRARAVEFDDNGLPLKLIGAHTDIDMLIRVQEELEKAKVRAEMASESKNQFLANMSHEIRTPLNGIFGMMQLLKTTELDSEQSHYVETALSSGRGLLTVINDILDFSKMDAGFVDLQEKQFNVRQTIASVMDSFVVQAAEKGLELKSVMSEALPPLMLGDEARLRQILFNLVGNALKFTATGSVLLDVFLTGRGVGFCVEDTGIGIPHDKLETMFDPFTQADGSYARRYQGTGLGLGIVKKLVHSMHGTLSVDSEPGSGTCVIFTLPLRVEIPYQGLGNDAGDPGSNSVNRLQVLVVEDDAISRMACQRFLEKLGHVAYCVQSGEEAVEAVMRGHFDCILMDVQMPGMSGLETAAVIRKAVPEYGKIPIIALTAHAMDGDRERFLSQGMDGYLSKPIDLREFKEMLASLA